jgi:L-lactate dehydrogenase complex protein LldG
MMLEKIRAANGGSTSLPEAQQAWLNIERDYGMGSKSLHDEMLKLFVARLEDYDAVVRQCAPDAIAEILGAMIAETRVKRVGVPEGFSLPALAETEVVAVEGLDHQALNFVEAVLTESTLGIAETGTLVLQGVPGQGRRALSLVPDVHFCVVYARDVVATVPEAIARLESTFSLPTTFISGPSATADIEMTRIKGVHGPRFLHVLLVI